MRYTVTVHRPTVRVEQVRAPSAGSAAAKALRGFPLRTMVEVCWINGDGLPRYTFYHCEGGRLVRVDGRVY